MAASTAYRDTTVSRGRIKDSVRNALWARAAGRCTLCNRRLLGDSRTYLHSVLLAELAHNIGATDGADSPRRDQDDGVHDKEAEENLLLMCHDCHKIIDDVDHREFFPPEKLRDIKDAFERRIEMATDHGGLTRTAALRVGGLIRGSLALASQREVAETLLASDYLGLVETQRSGDFTCRIPGSSGGRGYWDAGPQAIDDSLDLIHQAIGCGDVEHVSVFAIAPVPLLVYLGWKLDDKTPTRIFQKHRDLHQGWSWSTTAEPVRFDVSIREPDPMTVSGDESRDVVLTCGVSSPINPDLLPIELAGLPRVEVGPCGIAPDPTLITHEESLTNFASAWRRALATAEVHSPEARRWHLVASVPVTIAIEAGRSLMRDAHPPVAVYERLPDNSYDAVIVVNDSRDS